MNKTAIEADTVYLRKRGYLYRPNWSGYTASPNEAGLYDRAEAEAHIKDSEGVSIVELSVYNTTLTEGDAGELVAELRELAASAREPHCASPTIAASADQAANTIAAQAAENTAVNKILHQQVSACERADDLAEAAEQRIETLEGVLKKIRTYTSKPGPKENMVHMRRSLGVAHAEAVAVLTQPRDADTRDTDTPEER